MAAVQEAMPPAEDKVPPAAVLGRVPPAGDRVPLKAKRAGKELGNK